MTDLGTASREELLALIAQLQALVADQRARIARLEARLAKGKRRGMPGLKDTEAVPSEGATPPRKRRARNFGRRRGTPTDVVVHALERCPSCGGALVGGTVKRSRQVFEVEPSPVQVIEHVFVERRCRGCGQRWTPPAAELAGVVLGQQRLGVGLVSLIATLKEDGRLPARMIRWYLRTVHRLPLSVGAIVAALHRVAAQGQAAAAQIREQVRASPAVHADETGWRENGRNGYVWTFSTPTARYFVRRGRNKEVVDEVLGDKFSGILASDFYAAYDHYPGLKQRCWSHLLRAIHDLCEQAPADEQLRRWADRVRQLYLRARAYTHPDARARARAARRFEASLRKLCAPSLADPRAPQRTLCARIARHSSELFVFVAHPEVPADNNAAERSLRHLVTCRKISGGTRSDRGTETKMTLSTLFGTWRAQGRDPLLSCRQLLTQPQI
jgi:transposase